jgi:hypothetical protein
MHSDLCSLQHCALQYGDEQRGQLNLESAAPHDMHSLPSPVSNDRVRGTFSFESEFDDDLSPFFLDCTWLSVVTVTSDADTVDRTERRFNLSLSSCCIIKLIAFSPSSIH